MLEWKNLKMKLNEKKIIEKKNYAIKKDMQVTCAIEISTQNENENEKKN